MSIRYIIKQVLKEDEEDKIRSKEWEDTGIDDIMADIKLNNDDIESAFSHMGIQIDLDKIQEFGSIDRIKQAGIFEFSFILGEPVEELFGVDRKIKTKVIYRNSNDTLTLTMESGPYIVFDRNSLIKNVPMGGSARFSISSLLTKQNKGNIKAPGLAEGETYTVKFVDGDYESNPTRIKVLDVGFIKKSSSSKEDLLPAKIVRGEIQLDNDLDTTWTKETTMRFINNRLYRGGNTLRKSKQDKDTYVIELPSKDHGKVAVVLKPTESGNFDTKKRWGGTSLNGEWVNVNYTHRIGDRDIGESSGRIKLNLE